MAIVDVIKYEGGNDVLVWKHPKEDFNIAAQLIVHETQEAIIFKDGEAKDLYKPGKYTIETENIPGVRRVVSLVTGGVSPNHYEVYFINRAYSMNVFWGTTTPITIQDPVWQVPFKMRSHGQFAVRVDDSRKLLIKIVGTTKKFTQSTLTDHFKGLLMSRIKDYISNMMVQKQHSFLEINSYLTEISDDIKEKIAIVFANYGLAIEEFFVESINIEEDEVYDDIRKSMATRAKRKMEGYTYAEERSFDVAETQAGNEGTAGNVAGVGIGMGVGLGAGQVMGGMMNKAMQPMVNSMNVPNPQAPMSTANSDFGVLTPTPKTESHKNENICTVCNSVLQHDSAFCSKCGGKVGSPVNLCPKCNAELQKDAAFCHKCGAKFGVSLCLCPGCDAELQKDAAYCNKCGTKTKEGEVDE